MANPKPTIIITCDQFPCAHFDKMPEGAIKDNQKRKYCIGGEECLARKMMEMGRYCDDVIKDESGNNVGTVYSGLK